MGKDITFGEKFIEQRLSKIGGKVVKATEMTFQAKQLTEQSNYLLFEAQTEIADLYEALDDIFNDTPKSKKHDNATTSSD